LRHEWLRKNESIEEQTWYHDFQRALLLVPEHTWGMDEKTFLKDHENYSAKDFAKARGKANFRTFESSWKEKRLYIQHAVSAIQNPSYAASARQHLQTIHPKQPSLEEWEKSSLNNKSIDLSQFSVQFDGRSAAIVALTTLSNGKSWASPSHPLGLLRYQTFSAEDYERFFHQYIRLEEQSKSWSREDFTKPGIEGAHPLSRFWQPYVVDQYRRTSSTQTQFLFHLQSEPLSTNEYGCPKDFYLQYTFPHQQPSISIDLQWFQKPACRLPEALWFTFTPILSHKAEWLIAKLGDFISPLDVVENGNRHLHACGNSVICNDRDRKIEIIPLDSPLVAPGQPSLLNFSNEQPDMQGGVHFNLYNNVWGTNFPMWFDEDCYFRFLVHFFTTS